MNRDRLAQTWRHTLVYFGLANGPPGSGPPTLGPGEIHILRNEVESLRIEVASLREEVRDLRVRFRP